MLSNILIKRGEINLMLNKVEIDILRHLLENGLNNPMDSRTIKLISKGVGLNNLRVRNNITHLLMHEYVSKGYRERQSGTYYITKKGIDEIETKT